MGKVGPGGPSRDSPVPILTKALPVSFQSYDAKTQQQGG